MPMYETEITCPDCGKFLTDVDGLLECQNDYEFVGDGSAYDNLRLVKKGCGGSTGWTDEDWMVWYPGRGMLPNPTHMDLEARRGFMLRAKNTREKS